VGDRGKERKRFEKTQFHVWLELPMSLPNELTGDSDLASILTQRDEIEKFSNRFPNAAPIARKSLDLHGEWCVKVRAGMVRHLGEWMPKKAYLDLQAKREAEAQEAKAEEEAKGDRRTRDGTETRQTTAGPAAAGGRANGGR
jgi:hypothetical protein